MLSSAAALCAGLVVTREVGANSGSRLPEWGQTAGKTDLQAGPLGLNPALDHGELPVAMRIPDAGVDAEIEHQQIVGGQMADPSGPWVVAWYDQTARAGQRGNFIASGHVDYWDVGPSVFYEVGSLQEGALIEVTGKSGTVYTYEVEYLKRIDVATITSEELNSPEVVGTTDYAAITLITCAIGTFNGAEYTSRDLIRGKLVGSKGLEQDTAAEPVATETGEEEEAAPAGDGALAEGAQATINTDGINMRSEASTESEIIQTLGEGTTVTITGASTEADGYTWWPIELEDGTTGWVAQDFLTP